MDNRRPRDRRPTQRSYNDDLYLGMSYEYGKLTDEQRRRQRARKLAAQRRKRNNRIKLILLGVIFIALVVSIVVGISSCVKGCSSDSSNGGFKTVTTSNSNSSSERKTEAGSNTADPLVFVVPQIEDDNSKGTFSSQGAVYLWKDSAYEVFGADGTRSDMYADLMNTASEKLGDKIKAYSMIVPLHSEMNLPDRLKNEAGATSQADNIHNAYSKFNGVQPINVYNTLAGHNSEYLYFKSDHHWTGLGAYYAYTAFCEQTNQKPMSISQEGSHSIPGFTGSFHTYGSGLSDTVTYYDLPYATTCTLYADPNGEGQPADVYYEGETGGENTYGVFINGDQPRFIIESEIDNEKKIAVVKESFGNAFVPYLSANYSEVHVLDMRSCGVTDLKAYCEENGIDEVLFINNIMSANSADRIADVERVIGK